LVFLSVFAMVIGVRAKSAAWAWGN
jgi:hypothetical protein